MKQDYLAETKAMRDEYTEDNQERELDDATHSLYYQDHEPLAKVRNELGKQEMTTAREHALKDILRHARKLTELPLEMVSNKNMYENLLVKNMITDTEDSDLQTIIQEYYQLRLRSLLLNNEFSSAVHNTENGHYYLKALHEQVLIELNLNTDFRISDASYEKLEGRVQNTTKLYDLESPYNLQGINNTDAIGYDRVFERAKAETAAENFDVAHESVFEKLLGDYFLAKRGEYKESNKLFKELNLHVFEPQDSHEYSIK